MSRELNSKAQLNFDYFYRFYGTDILRHIESIIFLNDMIFGGLEFAKIIEIGFVLCQIGIEFSGESNVIVFNAAALVSFTQIRLKPPFLQVTTEYFCHCWTIYQAKT